MNIILAGMPGSGKTTVAEILGKKLGFCVADTDAVIVKENGNISDIFANYGEEYFRNLETEVVKKICSLKNAVIATGGGCLLREENAKLFKTCGKIVYLKASLATLLKRLEGDNLRPLLAGDTEKRLHELLEERGDIYKREADFTIDTDGLTPEEVATKITEYVK